MFEPDYRNIVKAAMNQEADRLPLYEHNVSMNKIGEIVGVDMQALYNGDEKDLHEFFRIYCNFFKDHGYDVVTFEQCIGDIMPGGGALGDSRIVPVIQDEDDFKKYPWEEIPEIYFREFSKYFRILREEMPEGMKAIGGPGNGIGNDLCFPRTVRKLLLFLFQPADDLFMTVCPVFHHQVYDL